MYTSECLSKIKADLKEKGLTLLKIDWPQVISKNKDGKIVVKTYNFEPSKTQEHFAKECDINHIMDKVKRTGEISHLARKRGVYADVSEIGDYQSMLHKIQKAEMAFDTLPRDVRHRFNQSPSEFVAFLSDKKNYDEAVKLGLIEPKEAPPAPPAAEPKA